MYGTPGVTHVSDEEQNSALSAFFSVKSNLRKLPSFFSMAKLNFGCLERCPTNMAIILFFCVSFSKPLNMFSCFSMETTFLITFTNTGIIESRTASINVVNGLIGELANVTPGARDAKTINAKASAPPKNPIRHTSNAIGATISETPIFTRECDKSGTKTNMTIDRPPKIIHILSSISLFLMSVYDAILSMSIAKQILTVVTSNDINYYRLTSVNKLRFLKFIY